MGLPVVRFIPLASSLWQRGYNGFILPIQTYGVNNLGAGRKELVDLKLADLAHRGPPLPLSEVGCLSAPPWGVACGKCPHAAILGHKSQLVPLEVQAVSFSTTYSIETALT